MWEGEGWLGTERLRSTKPFWLLKIFLASLIAPVAGGPAFRREHLLQMWLPDNLFSSKPPLFIIWERDKERSMPAEGTEQLFSQAWGANGEDAVLWKAGKESRNREINREIKKQEPEPSRSSKPSLLFFAVVSLEAAAKAYWKRFLSEALPADVFWSLWRYFSP